MIMLFAVGLVLVGRVLACCFDPPCKEGDTGLIPHRELCQAYFNCSYTGQPPNLFFEPKMRECKYPDLFNGQTCDDFWNVDCGSRIELKDPCDYRINQCDSAPCRPCYFDLPSCQGLSDGKHENPVKRDSPYYIDCLSERNLGENMCSKDKSGQYMLFDENSQTCKKHEDTV